jgi:hypothetical protein
MVAYAMARWALACATTRVLPRAIATGPAKYVRPLTVPRNVRAVDHAPKMEYASAFRVLPWPRAIAPPMIRIVRFSIAVRCVQMVALATRTTTRVIALCVRLCPRAIAAPIIPRASNWTAIPSVANMGVSVSRKCQREPTRVHATRRLPIVRSIIRVIARKAIPLVYRSIVRTSVPTAERARGMARATATHVMCATRRVRLKFATFQPTIAPNRAS